MRSEDHGIKLVGQLSLQLGLLDSLLVTISVGIPSRDLRPVQYSGTEAQKRTSTNLTAHAGLSRALGAGQNLKEFDIDNKYGANAVKQVLNSILAGTQGHVESAVNTAEVRGGAQQQAADLPSSLCLELCMFATVPKAIELAWSHLH